MWCRGPDRAAASGTRGVPQNGAVSLVNASSVLVAREWDRRSTGCHRTQTPRNLQQPNLPALVDGLGPVDDAELAHDVAQVRFDGLLADEELLADITVG
jgi:hypothetical protein